MKELATMLIVSMLLNYAFVILFSWKIRKLESDIHYLKLENKEIRKVIYGSDEE